MSIKLRIINVSDSFQNFTLRDALALPLHPSNPIEDRRMIYTVDSDKTPSLVDGEFSSEVLDGLITETITPWRTCSLQEQNEEFSKPAPVRLDANNMGKDNL